jgi:hypothetical protein
MWPSPGARAGSWCACCDAWGDEVGREPGTFCTFRRVVVGLLSLVSWYGNHYSGLFVQAEGCPPTRSTEFPTRFRGLLIDSERIFPLSTEALLLVVDLFLTVCSISSLLSAFHFYPVSPANSEYSVDQFSSTHAFAYNVLQLTLQDSPLVRHFHVLYLTLFGIKIARSLQHESHLRMV